MSTERNAMSWMKHTLLALAVAVAAVGLTSCEEDDDSTTGDGIGGIWRSTTVENGNTVLQETVNLGAGGICSVVNADFVLQECFGVDGTWSATDDSVTTIIMGVTTTVAYSVSGDAVSITNEDGTISNYSRVGSMPTCDDYGFGGTDTWDGTFTANVGGTVVDFSTNLYVETEASVMGFGGFNGSKNLAFVLENTTAGTYNEDTAAGTYMPNITVTTDAYISTSLTLNLSMVESNHIVGTFSFEDVNPFNFQTISVTDGQINITHP